MKRLPTPTGRVTVVAACLAAGLLAGAFAQAGLQAIDTSTTIHACRLVPSGLVRIVGEPSNCRRHERHLSWNGQGTSWSAGTPRPTWCERRARPSRTSRPGRAAGTRTVGPAGPPGRVCHPSMTWTGWPARAEQAPSTWLTTAGVATLTCVTGDGGGDAAMSVNELMTGVTAAATDEFVEIANTGTAAADLSGWKLVYRSAAGTSDVVLAVPDGTSLAARPLLSVRRRRLRERPGGGPGYSTSIAATGGGVGIRDAGGNLVDSVGWGTATNAFVEGTVAAAPATTDAPGTSIGRIPDGDDTGDNAADFVVDDSPTPKGSNG